MLSNPLVVGWGKGAAMAVCEVTSAGRSAFCVVGGYLCTVFCFFPVV
jgi:hypothetical protein